MLEYMENEILIVIIIYISVKLLFPIIIKISFCSFWLLIQFNSIVWMDIIISFKHLRMGKGRFLLPLFPRYLYATFSSTWLLIGCKTITSLNIRICIRSQLRSPFGNFVKIATIDDSKYPQYSVCRGLFAGKGSREIHRRSFYKENTFVRELNNWTWKCLTSKRIK